MRMIAKGAEPVSLTTHRSTPHCDYDNYPDKDTLRTALVAEQRGLCCYCMCRIEERPASMKIEHWRCRANYPERELDYRNLLASCRGGEGMARDRQHCDTSKADDDLLWNPADSQRRVENRIRYGTDGAIQSDDPRFDRQLNDVLNLNLPRIRNQRKASLDSVLQWWRRQRRPVSRQRVEREIVRRQSLPILAPYVQVGIWWLERRLS